MEVKSILNLYSTVWQMTMYCLVEFSGDNTTLRQGRFSDNRGQSKPIDKMLICLYQLKMKFGSRILPQIRPPPPSLLMAMLLN